MARDVLRNDSRPPDANQRRGFDPRGQARADSAYSEAAARASSAWRPEKK